MTQVTSKLIKQLKLPDERRQISLSSRPTIKVLQSSGIIRRIGPQWYELGIALLDDDQLGQLEIIESNNNKVTRQCTAMLRYWLDSHSNATWQDLIKALKAPGVELSNVAAVVKKLIPDHVQTKSESVAIQTDHQDRHEVQPQGQSHLISGTTKSFAEFESVSEAFVFLTSQLMLLLAKTNFSNIKRSCIEQINTPSGAQLPPELVTRVNACKNVTKLFEVLADSAYWSWVDIRLLKVMAAASGLVEAIKLISNYSKIIFSKRLIDLLPNAPNKEVKEKYYTKIVTKLNKNPRDMTVADLLEFRSQLEKVLLDIKDGICILEHLEEGCIEVHWFIPTNCAERAYQTAKLRCHQFGYLHLQSLKIGRYPVIHDLFSSDKFTKFIPSPAVNVGIINSPLKTDYTTDTQPNNSFSPNDSLIDSALTKEMEAFRLDDLPVQAESLQTDITKPATTHNKYSDSKPEIIDLIEFVIPKIQTEWEGVAFALKYEIQTVNSIKDKHQGVPKKCCKELLKDWLTTGNGKSPKTWSTLLDALRRLDDLKGVIHEIEKDFNYLQ